MPFKSKAQTITEDKDLVEKISQVSTDVLAREYGALSAIKVANMYRHHPMLGMGLGALSGRLEGQGNPALSTLGGAIGGAVGMPLGAMAGYVIGALVATLLKRPHLSRALSHHGSLAGGVMGAMQGGGYGGQLTGAAERGVRGVGRAAVSPLEYMAASARTRADQVFGTPTR